MAIKINLLIIEDHPTMIDGYKSILLAQSNNKYQFEISTAHSCLEAYKTITTTQIEFEIILLDLILPPSEINKLFSGEDVALLIRQLLPNSKIIILTSHSETFLLYNVIKNIKPEGLLVKSDFSSADFIIAINSVLNENQYYSSTVKNCLKEIQNANNYLDALNRRIISLLSKGVKTKNLPNHLNLSISAIDKRKSQIRDVFGIQKGNDEDIIAEAKKRGFI